MQTDKQHSSPAIKPRSMTLSATVTGDNPEELACALEAMARDIRSGRAQNQTPPYHPEGHRYDYALQGEPIQCYLLWPDTIADLLVEKVDRLDDLPENVLIRNSYHEAYCEHYEREGIALHALMANGNLHCLLWSHYGEA